jgi:hypothetical protein
MIERIANKHGFHVNARVNYEGHERLDAALVEKAASALIASSLKQHDLRCGLRISLSRPDDASHVLRVLYLIKRGARILHDPLRNWYVIFHGTEIANKSNLDTAGSIAHEISKHYPTAGDELAAFVARIYG